MGAEIMSVNIIDRKGQRTARLLYPMAEGELCEHCPRLAVDHHHKDGNDLNNQADNIAKLCRRCHLLADGRLEVLKASHMPKGWKGIRYCSDCGAETSPMRKGMCARCYHWWKRKGTHRAN
jgi:NMD protein affecting ribosome stability and mRNA decay